MSGGLIFGNKIIDVVVISTTLAQLIKVIMPLFFRKKIDLTRLFETGGFPSSHSASVVCLCVSIAIVKGLSSIEFAISFVFATITMYDATGIRQEAGKHAKILNQILNESKEFEFKTLKEYLGHTPFEVLSGAILGIIISLLMRGYLLG